MSAEMSAIELDARAVSSTGLQPQFAAGLAYLAGPFSGVILLLAERTNAFVRFHAWQAVLGLGGLGLVAAFSLLFAFLGLFFSPAVFRTLYATAAIAAALWLVAWGLCLFKAFAGRSWKLPLIGGIAARHARPPR